MIKIGLVGDKGYGNRTKIKEFIFKLKQKGNIQVVGCGSEWHIKNDIRYINNWVGHVVKQFTLEMELPYSEFPPVHHVHNMYCVLKPLNYGKPFKAWNYNIRDKQMVKYCDKLVLFMHRDTKYRKNLTCLIKESERLNKPFIIVNS